MQTAPSRRGVFYGWKVVAVSFLIAVFAWGLGFYGPSVYVNQLVRTNGWPVSAVSGAITFHFLFSAGLVIGLTDAYRRFGVVAITRIGIVAFGLGVVGFAYAFEIWHLYAAAIFTATGWATLSGAAINTFVSPWFEHRRGVALSHAFNGASIGGVAFIPLWTYLIDALGFPAASILVAIGGLLVLWPLAGTVLRRTPTDVGQFPDDDATPRLPKIGAAAAAKSRAQLLDDRRFTSLSIAYAIGIFAQMGLITHLIVRLTPDIGAQRAASALSIATCCAIVGRYMLAWFVSERRWRAAGAVNFLVQAVGVVLLILGTDEVMLFAGVVLFGLGIGNLLSLPPLILQSEQRPVDVGRALALLTAINQVVFAFGPGAFGLLRDLTGSYTVPFVLAAVTQVISALVVMSGGRAPAAAAPR